EQDPARRPQSADEFVRQLKRGLPALASRARPKPAKTPASPLLETAPAPPRFGARRIQAAGIALTSVVIIAGALLLRPTPAPPPPEPVVSTPAPTPSPQLALVPEPTHTPEVTPAPTPSPVMPVAAEPPAQFPSPEAPDPFP